LPEISASLIAWFRQHKRILPWRDNPEPYRVWISEIMLQQTRVQAVISFYERFLAKFPNLDSLAAASEEEVLLSWQGLGYYSRARNLHLAAQIIKNQFESRFPDTYDSVLSLPGIGKYTAAAILSIAFNQQYPVIDGNVLRVMARLFCITNDIRLPETDKTIADLLSQIFPPDNASDFNQGMMELGALICIPKQPRCSECPLAEECKAYQTGKQLTLPYRSQNPKQIVINRIIFLISKKDSVLIHLRPAKGLLASMWEFPGVEGNREIAESHFRKEYKMDVHLEKKLFAAEHVFTHRHWKMTLYEASLENINQLDEKVFKWARIEDLDKYPIPNAFKAILDYVKKQQ
jgi:A/G-specific adenine glycosylase